MPPPNLPFVAAKHVLGLTTSEQLVQAADATLASGIYSSSLGALYTLSDLEIPWKAFPLFATALRELGIPLPSKEEAGKILVRHYLCLIAEGTCTPAEVLARFKRDYDSLRYTRPPHPVTATPEWRSLEQWYWDHKSGRRAARDREVRDFATAQVREHSPGALASAVLNWQGGALRDLAQAITDERRFDDLPILADALEEAGCDNAALLQHCRWPGEHVRGCWVLDLILCKT
jgi:hypothetical protein